jgi:hypothetical protein
MGRLGVPKTGRFEVNEAGGNPKDVRNLFLPISSQQCTPTPHPFTGRFSLHVAVGAAHEPNLGERKTTSFPTR